MIHFACPTCGTKFSVKDEFAGKKGACKSCKAQMTVPQAAANLPVVVAPPPPESQALYTIPRQEAMPTVVPLVVPTQVGPTETACPMCGETILANAKRCKHCGETLDLALRVAEEAKKEAQRASRRGRSSRQSSTV